MYDFEVDVALFFARRAPDDAGVDAAVPRVEHDAGRVCGDCRGARRGEGEAARKQQDEGEREGKKSAPSAYEHTLSYAGRGGKMIIKSADTVAAGFEPAPSGYKPDALQALWPYRHK